MQNFGRSALHPLPAFRPSPRVLRFGGVGPWSLSLPCPSGRSADASRQPGTCPLAGCSHPGRQAYILFTACLGGRSPVHQDEERGGCLSIPRRDERTGGGLWPSGPSERRLRGTSVTCRAGASHRASTDSGTQRRTVCISSLWGAGGEQLPVRSETTMPGASTYAESTAREQPRDVSGSEHAGASSFYS